MIHYLVYVSQASQKMHPDELTRILESSRDYNRETQVTGLLIYKTSRDGKRASFMQLLEGDQDAVKETFRRISADERHHTKVVLDEGTAANRSFPDWLMGFRNLGNDDLSGFDGFSDLGEQSFWDRAQTGKIPQALDVMKSFYNSDD